VPLQLYFKDGRAKVELALVKGKKGHDKRDSLAEKQAQLDINRALSRRQSGKDY
jgi:SsrA-binding protein